MIESEPCVPGSGRHPYFGHIVVEASYAQRREPTTCGFRTRDNELFRHEVGSMF
jgi:hypothetical protein